MYLFPFLLQIPTNDSSKKDENTRKSCPSPKQSQKQRTLTGREVPQMEKVCLCSSMSADRDQQREIQPVQTHWASPLSIKEEDQVPEPFGETKKSPYPGIELVWWFSLAISGDNETSIQKHNYMSLLENGSRTIRRQKGTVLTAFSNSHSQKEFNVKQITSSFIHYIYRVPKKLKIKHEIKCARSRALWFVQASFKLLGLSGLPITIFHRSSLPCPVQLSFMWQYSRLLYISPK